MLCILLNLFLDSAPFPTHSEPHVAFCEKIPPTSKLGASYSGVPRQHWKNNWNVTGNPASLSFFLSGISSQWEKKFEKAGHGNSVDGVTINLTQKKTLPYLLGLSEHHQPGKKGRLAMARVKCVSMMQFLKWPVQPFKGSHPRRGMSDLSWPG